MLPVDRFLQLNRYFVHFLVVEPLSPFYPLLLKLRCWMNSKSLNTDMYMSGGRTKYLANNEASKKSGTGKKTCINSFLSSRLLDIRFGARWKKNSMQDTQTRTTTKYESL